MQGQCLIESQAHILEKFLKEKSLFNPAKPKPKVIKEEAEQEEVDPAKEQGTFVQVSCRHVLCSFHSFIHSFFCGSSLKKYCCPCLVIRFLSVVY